MNQPDDLEFEVRLLLEELCVKLGFCLPPEENHRLEQSPPTDIDSFTDAVFIAEGMGDMSYTDLRRQVRNVVEQHMSSWARPGDRASDGDPEEDSRWPH